MIAVSAISRWSTLCQHKQMSDPKDTDQIRRARILLCRTFCVEHSTAPCSRNNQHCYTFKRQLKTIILFQTAFVDST